LIREDGVAAIKGVAGAAPQLRGRAPEYFAAVPEDVGKQRRHKTGPAEVTASGILTVRPRLHGCRCQIPLLCIVLVLAMGHSDGPAIAQPLRQSGDPLAVDDETTGSLRRERWPDEETTGVPKGVTLRRSGDIVITKAGTVVSGVDVRGTVTIKASNVTLMNCKVTAAAWSVVRIAPEVTGTVVKYCEINGVGSGNDGSCGINGQGTFFGNNIYNVENGINLTGSATIKDNYIHGLLASGSPHYDGIQIDGGISDVTISHNTIIVAHGQTSTVMIDNYYGPISNIKVENNRLIGGGFTVYSDGQFRDAAISGIAFVNNRLGRGYWGFRSFVRNVPIWRGNVDDATGKSIAENER
jgi:hypothetical protein